MKTQLDRRIFLGAAGASVVALPGKTGRAAPNDPVRAAVIGLRSRGLDHARLLRLQSKQVSPMNQVT